jgi:hypothetical protein
MTVKDRDMDYCPWGCGQQRNSHNSTTPCPPQDAAGHWTNGPDKALGATPQLQQDVKALEELKKDADCMRCGRVLNRRISVISQELHRRGA